MVAPSSGLVFRVTANPWVAEGLVFSQGNSGAELRFRPWFGVSLGGAF
jgi:hypothetical protein